LPLQALGAESVEQRPKIGLVLGGGGAAGVAHVGVLKVLEEQGVPIDYIAGTSMGAIVGSLYAAGYNAAEMEDIVKSLDWVSLFEDEQVRAEQAFQQKRENAGFFNTFELGIERDGLKLPEGLISGQRLLFELRRLLQGVSHVQRFDRLPIPFRAVATDIETGERVVLSQGSLATAVRASMSIPGLFAPVSMNDRLLVDGFVSDNVPVDVVRQMGADIVIVVSIPFYFEEREKLTSAVAVTIQAMQFLTAKTSLPQLEGLNAPNVVLEPDVEEIGPLDFDAAAETIPLGETAARQQLAALQRLAALAGGQQARSKRRFDARQPQENVIDGQIARLRLQQDSVLSDQVVLNRLGIEVGERLTTERLQRALANVHSLGYFDLVGYELQDTASGAYDLTITARSSSTGNNRLRFGFSLQDDFEGGTRYQLGAKYIRKGVTATGGEWRSSAVIGDDVYLATALHQPLDMEQRSFLNPRVWHEKKDVYEYNGDERTAEVRLADTGLQLDWGRDLGQNAEWRVGGFYRYFNPELKTGQTRHALSDKTLAGLQLAYRRDTLDDADFPKAGSWFTAEYTHGFAALGADLDAQWLTVGGGQTWSRARHRVTGHLELGSNFNDEATLPEQLTLGGRERLSGLADNQLRGNHLALASGSYAYQLNNANSFATLYVGGSLEVGNVWQQSEAVSWDGLLLSSSLFLGLDSRFGPIYIGLGKTEGYEPQAFMQLGRDF